MKYFAHCCNNAHSHQRFNFVLGYKKIVISSKPTASSFSFGQKHKHSTRYDTDGPGPANYDVTGLSVKGIEFRNDDPQ